jgi:NAD(P)-dependent dehydrogenase (short-subunit alcohol dehydrogenase family)
MPTPGHCYSGLVFDLTGRAVLVTGAGRGVGAAIAQALAARGAVVAVNDVAGDRAEEVAAEIVATGGTAVAAEFDVTDYGAVATAAAALEREIGALDILVNNAGVPAGMNVVKFVDSDPAEWRKYVDLNLYGVMNCCRAVVPAKPSPSASSTTSAIRT